jgi:two-component system phosphate regulon sensor histidine kinase PhoR
MTGPSLSKTSLAATPGLVVLATLAMVGVLDWSYALSGGAIVLAGAWLITTRRSPLAAVRPDVDPTPSEGPRLEQAERAQLEAVVAGNQSILASLPDPLIMLDRGRRVVRANPAAGQLFGEGLVGRALTDLLRNPTLVEAADAVLAGGPDRSVEFSVPGGLAQYFRANLAGLPAPAPDGTVAIVSLHDLKGLKPAEQMRADFVANASHELRTPLASLLGFIETLSGPARDDEDARLRFLPIMDQQAQRMARLIEDLLSLSRIEMQEHSPPTGRVDLERVLKSVAGALEHTAREKSMSVEVAADDLPPVAGDRDELTQVFQNLIDNAVKYGRTGTEVTVTAEAGPAASARLGRAAVAVAIVDRGEGIPREHLPRLTERFYRVDTARSRQLGGTGLGLAIVKHIVSRHRGALEIKSEEGTGSTFTVHLPAASDQGAPPAAG